MEVKKMDNIDKHKSTKSLSIIRYLDYLKNKQDRTTSEYLKAESSYRHDFVMSLYKSLKDTDGSTDWINTNTTLEELIDKLAKYGIRFTNILP